MTFGAGTTFAQRREEKRMQDERRRLHERHRDLRNGRWPHHNVVYFIGCEQFVKIGISTNLKNRFFTLQQCNPFELHLLAYTAGGADLELQYHHRFAAARRCFEWFNLTPDIAAEIDRLSGRQVAA